MRVLNCFLDNRFGGPHKRAYDVADQLGRHGIDTIYLFNVKEQNKKPPPNRKSFLLRNLQPLNRHRSLLNLLLFWLLLPYNLYRICRIIDSENVQIVHSNGIMNIVPVLAAKLSGVRVLWHLNGNLQLRPAKSFFVRLVILFSDKVAVSAESVSAHYLGRHESARKSAAVLYPPVDTRSFDRDRISPKRVELLKAEFGISQQDIVIGMIGNINPAKGYEYFVEAAGKIAIEAKRAKFLIVGPKLRTQTAYSQKVENLVRQYQLEDRFVFAGFRQDIAEVLSVFDIFLLTSVWETGPIVVLEAMAMKVPVVATNVGAVPQQLGNGEAGRIVQPRDPQALAAAVLELLKKPKAELETMVDKGRERARAVAR